MMGDIKKRHAFAAVVNYANNAKKARLIDCKDVLLTDNKSIARSMQRQADDKIGRKLGNPVYHISLDFAPEDAPKVTDELMVEISRKYMELMGIRNTQYVTCRHLDTEHPHMHIVANRVDNDGNTISDKNDIVRSHQICLALTKEYGLHISKGKERVKRDRLSVKDKVRYQIYDAIKLLLPKCRSWTELSKELAKLGITTNFRFNTKTGKAMGVSFTMAHYSFNGSHIDRGMSFNKLDRLLGGKLTDSYTASIKTHDVRFKNNMEYLINSGEAKYIAPSTPDVAKSNTDVNEFEDNNDDSLNNPFDFGIVQISVSALMDLILQPYQAHVSAGGGGGHSGKWNDDDKKKDKKNTNYRHRR